MSNTVWFRLLHLFPDRGPCCLCGHRFGARHRMVDAVLERIRAGDPVDGVAAEFGLDAAALRAALGGEE